VIKDNWKLIVSYDGENVSYQKYHDDFLVSPRLYNLASDEHEEVDLAQRYPERVKSLMRELERWYTLEKRKVL